MKVLFFDVGYTLVNEDAVWKARCLDQAQTDEAPTVVKTLSKKYELGIIANQLDGLKERLD
ncbi:MAG: hypothetical protein PUC37_03820 [Spirochaetales bacterium]|nr:hypothetical protein [Spirochaetales bacterium]